MAPEDSLLFLASLMTYISWALNGAYLRVQQHSGLLTGHIWAGDGRPPALRDGQLNILLQALQRERKHRLSCIITHHKGDTQYAPAQCTLSQLRSVREKRLKTHQEMTHDE